MKPTQAWVVSLPISPYPPPLPSSGPLCPQSRGSGWPGRGRGYYRSVSVSYALTGFPTIMIPPIMTRICHIQDGSPSSSKGTPLQVHRSWSAVSGWQRVVVGGGRGPRERRNGGGGGTMCVDEAFCCIPLSEKIKRTVTLELASHTWCFSWHAAIITYCDLQLSQGLTVDKKERLTAAQ
jgi:hypothetical protein